MTIVSLSKARRKMKIHPPGCEYPKELLHTADNAHRGLLDNAWMPGG
jgi:hypothetical protein